MKLNQVYGITGIMGSGKSTVANLLKEKGSLVLDADNYAKIVLSETYQKYSEVKNELIKNFQKLAIKKFSKPIFDKEFNRAILGQLVFSDNKLLNILSQIIHPHVHYLLLEDLCSIDNKKFPQNFVFYDVPLLFETDLHKQTKKNVVVYSNENICIQRAHLRTGLPISDIKKRISSQISIEKKKYLADYVIDNSKDIDYLKKQVDEFLSLLEAK